MSSEQRQMVHCSLVQLLIAHSMERCRCLHHRAARVFSKNKAVHSRVSAERVAHEFYDLLLPAGAGTSGEVRKRLNVRAEGVSCVTRCCKA